MSYKNICELLKGDIAISPKRVSQLCHSICSLSRGGYIVMLGLSPLECMLRTNQTDYVLKYIQLLKEYDNGLEKNDIKNIEEMKKKYSLAKPVLKGLNEVVALIQRKYQIQSLVVCSINTRMNNRTKRSRSNSFPIYFIIFYIIIYIATIALYFKTVKRHHTYHLL